MRLFPDVYARCQNCGRGVDKLYRVRRFRVCAECYAQIVPPFERAETPEQVGRMAEFWDWYGDMDKRYPTKLPLFHRRVMPARSVVEFMPECPVCGRVRDEFAPAQDLSLWGKPRQCAYCAMRGQMSSAFRLLFLTHPTWDDEDALDWLYQHYPQAFQLGILPDYWFEMRRLTLLQADAAGSSHDDD